MKKLINLIPILLLIVACSTEPQEIEYGAENCHFCTMTISDDRFASELVLTTGKAQKYCSIECMVRDVNRTESFTAEDVDNYYVIDMTTPKVLVLVSEVTFLVSEKIQSPMGANLAAFKEKSNAQQLKEEWDGVLYNWDELKTKFN